MDQVGFFYVSNAQHKNIIMRRVFIEELVSQQKTLYKNAGQVGFAAVQVDFQVTCPAGRVAVGTFVEA